MSKTRRTKGKLKRLKQLEKYVSNIKSGHLGAEENLIPIFDPQTEQSVEAWVNRVDELAKSYGWNELIIVRLAANRLKGMARR